MTLPPLPDLANHLWQSTLVLGGACGLAWLLRHNDARVRFRVWLAASLKFLVPFAPLVAIGHAIGWPSPTALPQPTLSTALHTLNQPFVLSRLAASDLTAAPAALASSSWQGTLAVIWLIGCAIVLAVWTLRWLRVAAIVRAARPLDDPDLLARLRRAEAAMGVARPLRAVVSRGAIEPGVFGIVRPVLVWPNDLGAHLQGTQIDGVLMHELAHVRRRDNLTAALHVLVETIFWFFPPVWWLERQLVRDRELACDRAAMTAGGDPWSYAEGILRTCELCAESPFACVSGATGSELKKRIAAIVRGPAGEALGMGRRVAVVATAALAITMPVTLGVLRAPLLRAQIPDVQGLPSFEAASVRPNASGQSHGGFNLRGSQLVVDNLTLFEIIQNTWGIQDDQIVGGPDWVRSEGERFDITARLPDGATPAQALQMMQSLLAERFALEVRYETREVPVYALIVVRPGELGPRIAAAAFDCDAWREASARGERPAPLPPAGDRPACGAHRTMGRLLVGGRPMADVAGELSPLVGRAVVDRTGLAGSYDLELTWTPDLIAGQGGTRPAGVDPDAPSLFTAVEEQLGLKLEPTTGPIEVLVIDGADRPTPN